MFCTSRVVVNLAAGKLEDPVMTTDGTSWVNPGVEIGTPVHGQVFKVAENRITAKALDMTREFISFHVLYDDDGGAVTVDFQFGEKIDLSGGWCTGLPEHPLFAGEQCTPGAVRRTTAGGRLGGFAAYLVTVAADTVTKDSGQMRDPKSSICFRATKVNVGAGTNVTGALRCVYLRAISRPDYPKIYVGDVNALGASGSNAIVAYVGNMHDVPPSEQGYDSLLEVRVTSMSTAMQVVIESATLGGQVFAELPGQRWLGQTTCMATGKTHGPCDMWNRTLMYRPTAVQANRRFNINVQAVTKFPEINEFGEPAVLDIACTGALGPCKNGTDVANFLLNTDGARVRVEEWKPTFRFAKEDHEFVMGESSGMDGRSQLLYRSPADGPLQPPVRANPVMRCSDPKLEDDVYPVTCIRDPHPAYVNCPMKPFSMVVEMACKEGQQMTLPPVCLSKATIFQETEQLEMQVVSALSAGGGDAVSMGLKLSERLFIREPIKEIGQDNSAAGGQGVDVKYLAHTAATWTPPFEAMGHIFNVCVRAKGRRSQVDRCVAIEVKRCFYCTVQADTLHTIAAKFQTNWMQIWSANHDRMDELLDIDTVGTDAWKDTKNPNHIKPGTLIRLGPVYHSPVLTEVDWLLQEFRTTRESLLLANPNIHHAAAHIQPDESVCILPDICTQDREEWLRPKSKDSLFP